MGLGHVVDASVLIAALIDSGKDGLWSEQVIAGGFLAAPHLAIIESLNILRRLEMADQLAELEVASACRDLHELEIELLPVRPFEDRIWELRRNLTCYDAWYVAIAEALDLPLATLDQRMARAPGLRCDLLAPGQA